MPSFLTNTGVLMNEQTNWTVYLSGEIHTDWREQIEAGAKALNLPVNFTSAEVTGDPSDHNKPSFNLQVIAVRSALTPPFATVGIS